MLYSNGTTTKVNIRVDIIVDIDMKLCKIFINIKDNQEYWKESWKMASLWYQVINNDAMTRLFL